ncbi:MAG: hypothetical protein ABWK02_01175 [Aquificaceae bacterium]
MIGGAGGAEWFQKPMSASAQISLVILHIVWGGITGFLYNPSQEGRE